MDPKITFSCIPCRVNHIKAMGGGEGKEKSKHHKNKDEIEYRKVEGILSKKGGVVCVSQ